MTATLAQTALQYAKAATTKGPNNQGAGQLSAPKAWTPRRSPADRQDANMKVHHLKTMAPAQGASMADVVDYGRQVAKAGAGNCLEQCAAAALYLTGQAAAPAFSLVMLEPPADHVFIAIGQADVGGAYPDSFAAWDPNAVIVDPWVGICCKAQNYPDLWKMKLGVMGAVGQELSDAGGWKKADDAHWTTAPNAHRKIKFNA
ncbi:MAG: hypothetical protein AAFX00_13210 [Pseudomonadota bacterium]